MKESPISFPLGGGSSLPSQTGKAGDVLSTDGTNPSWIAPSGSPGGADTNVQFNDGSAFGGNSGFTFTKGTGVLVVPSISTAAISNMSSNLTLTAWLDIDITVVAAG